MDELAAAEERFSDAREGRKEGKRADRLTPSPLPKRRGKGCRRETWRESAPPVAAKNRDDDDDCDDHAGEDDEKLKDLRGVHDCRH